MPKNDATGPEGQGSGTGRKLGKCSKLTDEEKLTKFGKGMGMQRKSKGENGKGKRLKSGEKSY